MSRDAKHTRSLDVNSDNENSNGEFVKVERPKLKAKTRPSHTESKRLTISHIYTVSQKTTLTLHTITSMHAHQPNLVIFGRDIAERICY